jgi:hypothetical protein
VALVIYEVVLARPTQARSGASAGLRRLWPPVCPHVCVGVTAGMVVSEGWWKFAFDVAPEVDGRLIKRRGQNMQQFSFWRRGVEADFLLVGGRPGILRFRRNRICDSRLGWRRWTPLLDR